MVPRLPGGDRPIKNAAGVFLLENSGGILYSFLIF